MMAEKLTTFDLAELLDSEESIRECLAQVHADGDSDEIIRAACHVAKARARMAKDTELDGRD